MARLPTPLLTLGLVPVLALVSRTREPEGSMICPPEVVVTARGQGHRRPLSGAPEGAPLAEGTPLPPDAYVELPLPPSRGWIAVRVRSGHTDAYAIEARQRGAWVEVGRIEASGSPGIRNRTAVEVEVADADRLALRTRSHAALAMACVRGPRWRIPLYLPIGFAIGLLFVVLRSIPLGLAERGVRLWARYDAVSAVAYGAAVLHAPVLLVAIVPAALLLRAWRRRRGAASPDPTVGPPAGSRDR